MSGDTILIHILGIIVKPTEACYIGPGEQRKEREMSHDLTGVYELVDAVEDIIEAADPARRETLARTIDAYAEDFPSEFFWATSAQAPMLLYHLLSSIDLACRPEAQSRPRPAIRLMDRKPEGSA
jgi:hypothetical protein